MEQGTPSNGFLVGLGYGFVIAMIFKIFVFIVFPQIAIKTQLILGAIIAYLIASTFVPPIWPKFLKRNTGIVSSITTILLLIFFS